MPSCVQGRSYWVLYLANLTLTNKPRFIQLNSSEISLNSLIKNLHIQSSELRLDSTLLDKNVFKYVQKISIEFCNLTWIDKEAFKSFRYLKEINFWLFNLKSFVQSAEMDWMKHLNEDLDGKLNINEFEGYFNSENENKYYLIKKQIFIELKDEKGVYEYPEKDFCLFKDFPHSRLVYPIISTNLELNCTCTLLWLIQHWKYSNRNIKTNSVQNCFKKTSISFNLMVLNCNFEYRLKSCNINSTLELSKPSSHSLSTDSLLFYFSNASSGMYRFKNGKYFFYQFVLFLVIFV